MRVEENKALAPFTTFGIGGPARWFAEARSEDDIAEAAVWARERGVPLFVLGGGSNLLVADAGFAGHGAADWACEESNRNEDQDRGLLSSGRRRGLGCFRAAKCRGTDCAGLECLAGIPGTVGGTPVQNVGAYGQEVASNICKVRAFDLQTGAFVEFSNAECGFAYRRSRFNTEDRGRYVVTRVDYRLDSGRSTDSALCRFAKGVFGHDPMQA